MPRDWAGWMCHPPKRLPAEHSDFYRKLHRAHCAHKDEPGHDCQGRLTVDRNGVTLQCPLCGDARKVYGDG